jgi:hypothetical protein
MMDLGRAGWIVLDLPSLWETTSREYILGRRPICRIGQTADMLVDVVESSTCSCSAQSFLAGVQ